MLRFLIVLNIIITYWTCNIFFLIFALIGLYFINIIPIIIVISFTACITCFACIFELTHEFFFPTFSAFLPRIHTVKCDISLDAFN